ncbi:plant intracellular ras group-related LRR 4 [Actinidia rufa]|uniref:Plant intracellular ras group-related LRR 4 n=1 Tax=Actinidia rufa TaxID=165716 RepID=A0A7J0GFD9_9ERIC|nr:plant intracellular ras group-related LRR 4 [Actinidia rufa]
MDSSSKPIDEVVEEIMRIHRSLPTRPGIDEVEAAKTLIQNVEKEDQARIEAISRQRKAPEVPEELFMVLQEMQKNWVEPRDAFLRRIPTSPVTPWLPLLQRIRADLSLENSASFSGRSLNSTATATASTLSLYYDKQPAKPSELYSRDDTFVKKAKATFHVDGIRGSLRSGDVSTPQILDSSLKSASSSGQDGEKLSLIKLASLIEVYSKKGTRDLHLQNKLMDQVDWLPDSIGKLSSLITLDLSENRIMALPATIGGPLIVDKIGFAFKQNCANQLTSLPATFGRLVRLEELDLSSNHLQMLPESIGSLISLKKLIVETNNIEEIPHSIGQCSSLRELRADYNRLKALPEAVGRVASLEILSVRYNNVRQLPTTMSSLSNLRELNVSFNELESLPESLCFATTIVKINISNNFADLQFLPRSIGNLELLEELDISNNQIRILPDSFRSLLRLRVLNVEGNPLEVPPRSIADMGAQAVVQYMAELVAKRNAKTQTVKQKKSWAQICFFSKSNKRKRNVMDYVKA